MRLHDVTDKVQRAGLRIAAQVRESRVAALELRVIGKLKKIKIKIIREQKQASLSGEQDSLGRGERPPVPGHRMTSS